MSFNSAIRLAWKLPARTHRFWIELLSGVHLETLQRANMLKFYQKLISHEKKVIRVVSNYIIEMKNSTTGSNAAQLLSESTQLGLCNKSSSILNIKASDYKRIRMHEVASEDDRYKIPIMNELLAIRGNELHYDDENFQSDDITLAIEELAVN